MFDAIIPVIFKGRGGKNCIGAFLLGCIGIGCGGVGILGNTVTGLTGLIDSL